MHDNSNMRNKQLVVNTYKSLPFFKISRTLCLQNDPFFLISRFPIEKIPSFFRENGYERGIRFGQEWAGGCGDRTVVRSSYPHNDISYVG